MSPDRKPNKLTINKIDTEFSHPLYVNNDYPHQNKINQHAAENLLDSLAKRKNRRHHHVPKSINRDD
jgi:hypothetical protein